MAEISTHLEKKSTDVAGMQANQAASVTVTPSVLYDISILGHVYASKSPQAGIFRVVKNLAGQLACSEQCRVAFCSNDNQAATAIYLSENPQLSGVPTYFQERTWLSREYGRTVKAASDASVWRKAYLRPWRKTLHHALRLTNAEDYRLDSQVLAQTQIFHSTAFSSWPRKTGAAKHIQRVQTIYDMIPVLWPQWLEARNSQEFFSHLLAGITPDDWAICISEATKADLCEYIGMDPARAFVTPLAADAGRFYPCADTERHAEVRRRYRIPEGPYVLSLCTLEVRKNIDHVVRSFVRLVQEQSVPDLSLVLAGGKGWRDDKILHAIEGAGLLRDRIIMTGYVDDEDLAPLYSGALAFVYPSLYEGFGLPPLEAMQCGTPVVTSNTSSLPEVVGDAGIMLDPHDEDGLCQSLLDLYKSDGLRQERSRQSLERAKLFSWERCTQDTIAAYRKALAN